VSNRTEMAAVHEKFSAAVGRGDAAGMAACYTEKALGMYSNMDFVTGRSAIQKAYQGLLDMGNVKAIKFETVELEEHGDTAYEVGKYTMFGPEGKMMDTGKYVVIWKREEGQWKYNRDIANTSMPRA